MATIKAPFNFVPLSEKVYFPDWADQISQDIPFSDGVSGTIELKITAETPIFVRNGHTKDDAEAKNDTYKSFNKTPDGKYFIPATSIKGSIRNVLEIMSFGKMNRVSNNRYSIRDLQLKKYLSFFQNSDVRCGWLTFNGETATITDNGIPRRISHKDIDQKFNTDFCDKFSSQEFLKSDSNRSPIVKYRMVDSQNLTYKFRELPLNAANTVDKRIKVVFDEKGQCEGTIVFTGQPSFRKPAIKNTDGTIRSKASGKFYEFVFLNSTTQSYTLNTEEENGVYKDFCFIYKDSEEWKYWKQKSKKGIKIPIFFSIKNGQLSHFGLSYLYKLPYIQRIKDYLYEAHKSNSLDLSDCIFGFSDNKKSLRGRIQFSNAFHEKGELYKSEIAPYMGGPKPTYYPVYLKQNGNNGDMKDSNERGVFFSTMLDKEAKLKGWKRYPIRKEYQTIFNVPMGQEDNTNPFIPFEKGSEFSFKIKFHNLRKVELGALLSAIELRKDYYHSIGFAKPFGYGMSKIEITNTIGFNMDDIEIMKKSFIDLMSKNIENYSKTSQLKELLAMLHAQDLTSPLEYMELKEFVDCKKQHFKEDRNQTFGEYLPWYSEMIKPSQQVKKEEQPQTGIATITVWQGQIKQARLSEGENKQSIELIVEDKKVKLKIGDSIEVEKIMNGSNVRKLKFNKKL